VVGLLALLFLLIPIAELAVIIKVGSEIGIGNTIVVMLAMSVLGGWLIKREGVGVLRRVQDQMARGVVPTRELSDGFMIMLAGALMLTPGFLTDVVALLLLLPPVRAAVRAALARRVRQRASIYEVRGREIDPR
jgi:UPF0716 protein FxsA